MSKRKKKKKVKALCLKSTTETKEGHEYFATEARWGLIEVYTDNQMWKCYPASNFKVLEEGGK